MLGVSPSTILRAVRSGRLRAADTTPAGFARLNLEEARRLLKGDGSRPVLLTSTEAADRLGISRSTMARAVKAGRIRPSATTPGGHFRFAAEALPGIADRLGVAPVAPPRPTAGPAPSPAAGKPELPRPSWSRTIFNRGLAVRVLIVLAAIISLIPFLALVRGAVAAIREGVSDPNSIGVALSLTALLLGSIFFLYSIKYYLATMAMLLSSVLYRNGNGHNGHHGNGNGNGNGHPHGLMRFARRGNGNGNGHGNGNGNGNGHFDLGYEPFVSIHIATYNEKRVIGRLLEGCAAMDYSNYEVVVVDDSTDETAAILDTWRKHEKFKIFHRPNRDGFKGGALQVALRNMDPRTEFVLVWDADVVPFADSIQAFLPHFYKTNGNGNGNGHGSDENHAPEPRPEVAAVQSYQWHILNKSESWLTEAVRAEYAGSYMVERPFQEFVGSLKMVAGTAYMIRADLLKRLGWGRSLTEDWELTLRLYALGFKVVYTPYAESPAECVATFGRLARQRMRWAEGHSYNVRRHFMAIMGSNKIRPVEKLEFLSYVLYYLQAALFVVGSACWLISEVFLQAHVPDWTATLGWSLLFSNLLSLPLMNVAGLLLEGAPAKDFIGVAGAIATSFLLVPFQAFAAVKGFFENDEGPWYRTPKTGRVTDPIHRLRRLAWVKRWLGPPSKGWRGPVPAHSIGARRTHPPRRLGWIVIGALVLTLGGLGLGALHAPVANAAGTALYLHGASPFTMDDNFPSGAVQTFDMTAGEAIRVWVTSAPTSASQTISAGDAFTFNYWTAAAPAGTSDVTLSLGYSSGPCGNVISNIRSGPEVKVNSGDVAATLPVPSTAGDLLVVTLVGGNNVSAFAGPPGWTRAVNVGQAGDGEVEIWYLPNSPAGVTTATFTSASGVSIAQMSEWRGVSTASPIDQTGTATSAANVTSTTVSTGAPTATAGDLGITVTTWTQGGYSNGAGWSSMYVDNPIASASDFQVNLPAAVASETVTSALATLWADAIATFAPATVTTIAQTTATLTNGLGLSTASFSPASDVTVPAGSFLCFSVTVNSVTGGGLVLNYDAAATPTNLNSSQTILIPEHVLPFLGLALLVPLARRRRRMGAG
ncbi:MAG: glycosyltransferase [Candidatus Dormibacterales bacterium]